MSGEDQADGGIAWTREWAPGRWVFFLTLGRQLWFQDFPSGGRRWHWLRVSYHTSPAAPSQRVFSVVCWRLKVVWGRGAQP